MHRAKAFMHNRERKSSIVLPEPVIIMMNDDDS